LQLQYYVAGHELNYLRRIKTVALTIPCVAGPYVGVHCALSLVESSLRKTPNL